MYINEVTKANRKPKIIIFSGAGLSAGSGISTFRDSDGLWENHKIEEICNENTWKQNRIAVHNFYSDRREQLGTVEPNEAHRMVARIMKKYGTDRVINITQNVDDLFTQVGIKDNTMQVHGELTKMECEDCSHKWDIGYNRWDPEEDCCPECSSTKGVRPFIVFFYGQAPLYKYMNRAFDYTMDKDTIVLVIGTMGNVVPLEMFIRGTPCKKILCNLDKSKDINDNMFDKVYYQKVEEVVQNIEKDIDEFMKEVR